MDSLVLVVLAGQVAVPVLLPVLHTRVDQEPLVKDSLEDLILLVHLMLLPVVVDLGQEVQMVQVLTLAWVEPELPRHLPDRP